MITQQPSDCLPSFGNVHQLQDLAQIFRILLHLAHPFMPAAI